MNSSKKMHMAESPVELNKESNIIMNKKDTEKLVNRAKELSSDDEYIRLFDEEENYKELIRNTELAKAREEGIKLGSKRKAVDIAQKMLEANLDIKSIVKFTNLSLEEMEALRKKD